MISTKLDFSPTQLDCTRAITYLGRELARAPRPFHVRPPALWVVVRDNGGAEVACFWNDPADLTAATRFATRFAEVANES